MKKQIAKYFSLFKLKNWEVSEELDHLTKILGHQTLFNYTEKGHRVGQTYEDPIYPLSEVIFLKKGRFYETINNEVKGVDKSIEVSLEDHLDVANIVTTSDSWLIRNWNKNTKWLNALAGNLDKFIREDDTPEKDYINYSIHFKKEPTILYGYLLSRPLIWTLRVQLFIKKIKIKS